MEMHERASDTREEASVSKPLRVLILEDYAPDAELMAHELRRAGFDPHWERVETEDGFLAHLSLAYDVILADYTLPQFDAMRALELVRERGLDVPFLIVTATVGEDVAVECMKQGAADYLLKDRLSRLGPAVQRALEDKELREERRRAEEAREQLAREQAARAVAEAAQQRIASILESITDGFFATDRQWRFTYVNREAERILGRPSSALLGKNVLDEFPNLVGTRFEQEGRRALAENVTVTFEERYPSSNAWFEIRAYPTPDGLSVYFEDVTERKRTEEALRRSEARFKRLVESNVVGIIVSDEEKITEANDLFLEIVGYSRADLQAAGLSWRVMTPPEYRYLDDKGLEELRERGAYTPFEKEYFRKDGSRVPILIGGALVESSPLTWLCFVVDLSELKRAEREREATLIREQVARAEAQEAVRHRNELLAMVSHDLKNPLTRIKGYAQLLQRQVVSAATHDVQDLLEGLARIEATASTMNAQINQLVDLTRLQIGETLSIDRRPTDLVALVRRVTDGHQKMTQRHSIVIAVGAPEVTGNWDADRLERVLGNLIENAIKYSPNGGTITVSVERHTDNDGSCAVLSVRDEGLGISESDLPRIFERFYRGGNASGQIPGTGLGLAVVHHIVDQHGGTIVVESIEGRGSTFTIRLPLEAEAVSSEGSPATAP
jgi:PAS domain S-box-containing protein